MQVRSSTVNLPSLLRSYLVLYIVTGQLTCLILRQRERVHLVIRYQINSTNDMTSAETPKRLNRIWSDLLSSFLITSLLERDCTPFNNSHSLYSILFVNSFLPLPTLSSTPVHHFYSFAPIYIS